jgi:cell wall-associated NlpC family hydrolase
MLFFVAPSMVQAVDLCAGGKGHCEVSCDDSDQELVDESDTSCPTYFGLAQECCIDPVRSREGEASAGEGAGVTIERLVEPQLAVPIPNLKFSDVTVSTLSGDSERVSIPFLADYIQAVYDYAVGVAAALAAVMMMVGGFQYLTAGDSGRVSEAKKRITDALVGLILAMGAYTILSTTNSSLTNLPDISIERLKRIPYQVEEGGDTEDPIAQEAVSGSGTTTDIYCPKSGGSAEIPKILDSLKGRVTYRFGGKGGEPPYREERPQYMEFNTFCPEGTICLDCSGFTTYVLKCAGLGGPGGGTGNIFANNEAVTSYDIASATVNGIPLKPGDLIGYTKADSKVGVGHVLMYIGNGLVAESKGGVGGRQPGGNPRISSFNESLLQHITRVRRL